MNIKYLVSRIFSLNYKNLFVILNKIAKKTNKNKVLLFLDIVYCGLRYGAGYYDYQEFEFYNLNSSQRATYLTRAKNNLIIKKFNNKEYFHMIDDKSEFSKNFKEFTKRESIFLEDFESFLKFFKEKKIIMAKPTNGSGGKGIDKFEYSNEKETLKIFEQLNKKKPILIDECIIQHDKLNMLYPKSVNSLRMFTFIKDNKSYFLQGIIRIGNGGVVDNFCSGGMYAFISNDGKIMTSAIDQDDNIYLKHPITNVEIEGFEIPYFKEAIELVKEASKVVPEVGYVGWDVAISKDGPKLIEGNCFPGVFQIKPSLSKTKVGLIPLYNRYMKIF